MKHLRWQAAPLALSGLLLLFSCLQAAEAAKPIGGGGGGKPPAPKPDILYLSDNATTDALTQAAVRGTAFGLDGTSGFDVTVLKSKAGRQRGAIAWSPDGSRAAWFEIGLGMVSTPSSIVVGGPGVKPTAIYTSTSGVTPQVETGSDGLAWGPDCSSADTADSILVFAGSSSSSSYSFYGIRFSGSSPGAPELLKEIALQGDGWITPWAFAISPTGQHLAFAGRVGSVFGIWLLPLCAADQTPRLILTDADIGGFSTGGAPISSMDWSRHGDRLALSVTTNDDTFYTWRDLRVAYLDYDYVGGTETVTAPAEPFVYTLTRSTAYFGAASSEHSPVWAPDVAGGTCQRIAFSQSSDFGRVLYLLDVGTSGSSADCPIKNPLPLPSNWPRALDWK